MADLERYVLDALEESVRVKTEAVRDNLGRIVQAAETAAERLQAGNKILIFGNGGSAADAQHLAAEFVNRFRIERPPLPAIALTTDTSVITSIGNDYSFDEIFAKQIRALGRPGDVAVGLSTSGDSPNVLTAMTAAREIGLFTIGFTGRAGQLATLADLTLSAASDVTARIQETHIAMGHMFCDLVDRILFPDRFGGDIP
jgi:D-sedoheptulose 7-phosphate isomerase